MPPPTRPAPGSLQHWLRKALTLAIVTVLFGWFYGWASPWAFPKNHTADFKYGVLHGALMPLSLPTLVLDKDVPIYAPDNSGRGYKFWVALNLNPNLQMQEGD